MTKPERLGRHRDFLVLLAILALAAVVRLPGLDARGQWDADQGNEMLVLLHLVRDGQVPLLGPPTFAGTFHHGALYYYLLAPAALLSDADPRMVTLELALLGLATVAAIWGLGRALAGRWAGHVAGLLAAVSPAGVLGSTFIWNPNVVPLGSAIALLGATAAWRTRRQGWWLVAAFGTMLTMQLHVSGALLLPPMVVAFALDLRRGPRGSRRALALAGLGGAAIIAAGYLPLLVHEAATGFSDIRGLIAYLLGGSGAGAGAGDALPGRVLIVALRSVAWPFVGVVTEAPMAAAGVALIVVGLAAAAVRWATLADRPGIWLLLASLAWSLPALALTAPTLTTSIPGLPNDHYHTFLDPIVIAVVAAGIAALGRVALRRRAGPAAESRMLALACMVVLVAASVWRWPPAATPDGGWSLADQAAVRVIAGNRDGRTIELVSLPGVKAPDALRFPLERRRVLPVTGGAGPADLVVVVCDPLFDQMVGAPCGGPAESRWLADTRSNLVLGDRFAAGPRRIVSIYEHAGP